MIRTAYLRVYTPVSPAAAGRSAAASPWPRHLVRADGYFMWAESDADDAFEVEWNGRSVECPRRGRLRMLEGIVAFDNSHPGAGLLPQAAVQRAADELARIKGRGGGVRSQILSSPWHVPLRWFSAFESAEREIYEIGDDVSLRYRTDLSQAIDRVSTAVDILDRAGFDSSIVDQVNDLRRWLEGFPAGSMLELDYSSVAELFTAADLAFDDSVAEVAESLAALEQLDYEVAGEKYAAVASRWAPAQALTYVN